jgi:hypothetical protein
MCKTIAGNGLVMLLMSQQHTDKYSGMSRLLCGGCIAILMQITIEMKEISFILLLQTLRSLFLTTLAGLSRSNREKNLRSL